jgi:hypothetical protein
MHEWLVPLLVVGLAAAALALGARSARRALRAMRGTRVLRCPRGLGVAAVELDRRHTALAASVGLRSLRVRSCSLWEAGRPCAGECLPAIAAAPDAHLIRVLVDRWASGKACAQCACPLSTTYYPPALLGRNGVSVEYDSVPAESLLEALATSQPICWYCHVALALRREQTETVGAPRPRTP